MKIGILGTGRMGSRLAALFSDAGNEVLLGSRDLSRAEKIVAGIARPNITAVTYEEAAGASVVLPAMFLRDGMLDTLEPLRDRLSGKIWVDITNPFNTDYSGFILPWDTSGAEQIQHRFPTARIVGAFKNVWWEVFDAPEFAGGVSDVFVVGDNQEAKDIFFRMVEGSPFRYLDAGRLSNARTIERMTLLSGELGHRYGFFPRMNYRFLGEKWAPQKPSVWGL
jgi:8-hydroxy-5-deazaflavin:NADPH oxidoreductase